MLECAVKAREGGGGGGGNETTPKKLWASKNDTFIS